MKREKGQNGPLLHVKTSVPFNKDSLVEIVTVVLKIFKFRQYVFCYFVIISLWKSAKPLSEQTWNPFLPSLVKIGQVVLERILNLSKYVFSIYFFIISLWKRACPFIRTNLNFCPMVLCVKLGSIGQKDGRTTDNRRSKKLLSAFSLNELKRTYGKINR